MQRRPLGTSDIEVSPIGLGTWGMGGDVAWGPANDNESISCVHAALDLGVNLIDTAAAFGTGHAEEVIGKALADRRDKAVIATKCGLVPNPYMPGNVERCLSAESIFAECEASLRRLGTETIDLYQCHWPDPSTGIDEAMSAMNKLKEQGKIRAIGLSNYSTVELSDARQHAEIVSLQPRFSLVRPESADTLIPYCQEYRIAVLAYSPLHHGLLTGKLTADQKFADMRRNDPEFRGQRYQDNLNRVDQLRAVADAIGVSVVQAATLWTIAFPGVTSAIVGARRPSHVREVLERADTELSDADRKRIGDVFGAPAG